MKNWFLVENNEKWISAKRHIYFYLVIAISFTLITVLWNIFEGLYLFEVPTISYNNQRSIKSPKKITFNHSNSEEEARDLQNRFNIKLYRLYYNYIDTFGRYLWSRHELMKKLSLTFIKLLSRWYYPKELCWFQKHIEMLHCIIHDEGWNCS